MTVGQGAVAKLFTPETGSGRPRQAGDVLVMTAGQRWVFFSCCAAPRPTKRDNARDRRSEWYREGEKARCSKGKWVVKTLFSTSDPSFPYRAEEGGCFWTWTLPSEQEGGLEGTQLASPETGWRAAASSSSSSGGRRVAGDGNGDGDGDAKGDKSKGEKGVG